MDEIAIRGNSGLISLIFSANVIPLIFGILISIKATQNQIVNSKNLLEDNFGIGVDSFCYPYGKYNLQVLQIVKNFYKNAVTTNRSRYCYSKHNPYLIPRIDMGKKLSKFKMFMKLNTFYEDIKF